MAAYSGRDLETAWWSQPNALVILADLWVNHPEISAKAIGKRLGCSKNAVISKANRMKLPPRVVAEPQEVKPPGILDIPASGCHWPIGHPRDADFHFCGKPADEGKSYCAGHRAIGTIKPNKAQRLALREPAAWR
jgi:GcrA cell cycle regulator